MGNNSFEFDLSKSAFLRQTRGIGFEEIISIIEDGGVLSVLPHPNQNKHPEQQIYILDVCGYVWMMPVVVKDNGVIRLITCYPSRKETKKYSVKE